MVTWQEFAEAEPELAEAGRALFYQFGIGLGFLATVRRDGGPRLHPVCPIIAAGGLYAFIGDSPKRRDLRRDGRYAMHSFPPENVDDEFYLTGRATPVDDPALRASVRTAYVAMGALDVTDDEVLFAFSIEHCLHAKYKGRPDWPPTYTKWRAA